MVDRAEQQMSLEHENSGRATSRDTGTIVTRAPLPLVHRQHHCISTLLLPARPLEQTTQPRTPSGPCKYTHKGSFCQSPESTNAKLNVRAAHSIMPIILRMENRDGPSALGEQSLDREPAGTLLAVR
jgi:hypothetical protein